MINKIIFPENYKISNIMFCKEIDCTKLSDKRVVPLFGPNGIGKTTLLSALCQSFSYHELLKKYSKEDEDYDFILEDIQMKLHRKGCVIEADEIPYTVARYFNSNNNLKNYSAFDPFLLNARFEANSVSEGQSIIYSVTALFDILRPGKDMLKTENGQVLVFLDEMDSGLSVDNIDTLMRKMKNILRKREDIQIFFSFNNPRVLKAFPEVISLYDGSVIELHSDEDMIKEIRKHKKTFDKVRKKSNGMPKIYN